MGLVSVLLEGFAVELGVVHLAKVVDQLLEEAAALLEIVELIVHIAEFQHKVEHVFLAFHRAKGINAVEGVLLEEHEVDQFGLPETDVVADRHTIVSEDVDLLVGLPSPTK